MRKNRGQVALVVLIISAIALTLGLSLADRVRTDIKTDTDDEQLQRAFNAAESGIENYLVDPGSEYEGSDGSLAEVSSSSVIGDVIGFEEQTIRDHYAYFWLVGHNGDDINMAESYGSDSIGICYNDFPGAMAVYYFYVDAGNYKVDRTVYNIQDDWMNDGINDDVYGEISGMCEGYSFGMSFNKVDGSNPSITPLLLVIRPINGASRFAVMAQGGATIPSQGIIIDSIGRSGKASTTVSVYKRWDPSYYMSFLLEGLTAESSID